MHPRAPIPEPNDIDVDGEFVKIIVTVSDQRVAAILSESDCVGIS